MKFIRENKDRPFFCYLPITPPHGIFDIPDDDPAWALYKDEAWPEQAKRYAAMVDMVDRQVGEMLALLKELGPRREHDRLLLRRQRRARLLPQQGAPPRLPRRQRESEDRAWSSAAGRATSTRAGCGSR